MAHRIDYSDGGTRARIQLDLDNASVDAPRVSDGIGAQWQDLLNVLNLKPGMLTKRGTIGATNSTNINDASGVLAFYGGKLWSSVTARPYYGVCLDGSNVEHYLQTDSTTRTVHASGTGIPLPVSRLPTVRDMMIVCGVEAANATYPTRPTGAELYSGTLGSSYSTGTIATTAGSPTVTGTGTTWTSAMVGMVFWSPGTGARIISKVLSTTSLVIDENAVSSQSGVSAYSITRSIAYSIGSGTVFGSGEVAAFKIACGAWGRVVVAHTREPGVGVLLANDSPEFPGRIRWSGVIGSDDGSGVNLGMFAFDNNGYLDVTPEYGSIVALAPTRDALLVFQEYGLTVVRGAPVFDGAGSLDQSEVYPGVSIYGGFGYEVTPEGVFFSDKHVGPCVYDGTQVKRLAVPQLAKRLVEDYIQHVGYYDGNVLFGVGRSGRTGVHVFNIARASWTQQNPAALITCLGYGRTEAAQNIVGLGAGQKVVNLTTMFTAPGNTTTDWDGTAIVIDLKTGKIGDPLNHLRPERLSVTYRMLSYGLSAYLQGSIRTGISDTPDAAHTYTTTSTDIPEITTSGGVRTAVVDQINIDRDPMVQLRLLQTDSAFQLDLISVVIDCSVEGEGFSST